MDGWMDGYVVGCVHTEKKRTHPLLSTTHRSTAIVLQEEEESGMTEGGAPVPYRYRWIHRYRWMYRYRWIHRRR